MVKSMYFNPHTAVGIIMLLAKFKFWLNLNVKP